MDKPNQFKSSQFFMDEGDILHMILKGESGTAPISIELMGVGSTVPEDYGGDTLEDYDGNEYTEITIGNQKWIVENFRCTHYADGTAITNLPLAVDWAADATGAYCWYNNDAVTYVDYGIIYNGYAVKNVHGLAYLTRGGVQETGWRVPTQEDINTLISYIGGDNYGGKLKEVGDVHWDWPNSVYATNEMGFTAFGAGRRHFTGLFSLIKELTFYWTDTISTAERNYYTYLEYNSKHIYCGSVYDADLNSGLSVRLVKPMGEITTNYILAGTSYGAFILRSVNKGISFSNQGSAGYGKPQCFVELVNGDILYGTDQGYVVNYTQGTFVNVCTNVLNAIAQSPLTELVMVGDNLGNSYSSNDNGQTFGILHALWAEINAILMGIEGGSDFLLYFHANGIYKNSGNVQVGNFTCACDIGVGAIYAGDSSGHVWQSVDYGATWLDMGLISAGGAIISIIMADSFRMILYAEGEGIFYTDDYFITPAVAGAGISNNCYALTHIGEGICLAGDVTGDIHRSIDNGANWTEIAGNPQAGESSINCLIYID